MLELIKNGIILQFRDRQWVVFMLLFPIVLITLISYVMSDIYDKEMGDINQINLYHFGIADKDEEGLKNYFSKSEGKLSLFEVEDFESGKSKIKSSHDLLLEWKEDERIIYSRTDSAAEKLFVSMLLKELSNESGTYTEHIISPTTAEPYVINRTTMETNHRSIDYYGIVIINMMVLYTAIIPIVILDYDKKENIIIRLSLSGIKKNVYYLSRILTSVIVGISIIIPVILFSKFVLQVHWGVALLGSSIYLMGFVLFSIMLGVAIYCVFQTYEKSIILLQTMIIPAFSFLGGSYIKIPKNSDSIFAQLSNLSPLKWVNEGVLQAIHIGNYHVLDQSLLFNVIGILLFLAVVFIANKREKGW